MIRVFCQLLLFLLILVSIKWLLVEMTNPMNSSPDALPQKIRLIDAQKTRINTLFIGSSRTYTGLIPNYFDSLTRQTCSLNLGVSSLYMPHTADLCQQVLYRQDLPVRYILFELSLPADNTDPFQGKLIADAGFYWQYWLAPSAHSEMNPITSLFNYLEEYLYNLISPLGQLYILKMKLTGLEEKVASLKARYFTAAAQQESTVATQHSDYERLANESTSFNTDANGYINSRRKLNRLSPELWATYQRGLQIYQPDSLLMNPAYSFYREKLNILHQLAAQRGVKILFFLPSRLTAHEATVLIPIFRQLAPDQRLVIARDTRFDQLFAPRFSMDESHLNDDGARIYTTLMAETFRRQTSQMR